MFKKGHKVIGGFQKGNKIGNRFKKGHKYRIKKGQHLSSNTEFKKGHPPNKTSFKKGHIPYFKGTKGLAKSNSGSFKKGQMKGKKNWNWKNGKRLYGNYIYLLMPEHPFCNKAGYIKRSRLVMEKMLGRYLKPEEVVHHRGTKYPIKSIKNRQDDRPKNLKLFANKNKHHKFHFPKGSHFSIN